MLSNCLRLVKAWKYLLLMGDPAHARSGSRDREPAFERGGLDKASAHAERTLGRMNAELRTRERMRGQFGKEACQ
jgi:hypothetical protein